jgi:hypothetical protein
MTIEDIDTVKQYHDQQRTRKTEDIDTVKQYHDQQQARKIQQHFKVSYISLHAVIFVGRKCHLKYHI